MKLALIAAGLALGLVAPLAAQTPGQAPEPKPTAPAQAAPSTAPEAPADPRAERQRNTAAKLAGMIRFVDASCPDAQPDYDRFKQAIAAMGVDIKELESGPLMATSLGYSQAYDKDKDESCKRALENFGENGRTLPGLIAKKVP